MSQAQRAIEEMVKVIFGRRWDNDMQAAEMEHAELRNDVAKSGMAQSSVYVNLSIKVFKSAVYRAVSSTFVELDMTFRRAGRRDPILFWNSVEPNFQEHALGALKSANATVINRASAAGMYIQIAQADLAHSIPKLEDQIKSGVHEFRTKAQFSVLKTPEDRRAHGVPDVAVMMWFPDPKRDSAEEAEAAQSRYDAIRAAVADASNGSATSEKINDPEFVPQDRISAIAEVWLEKAVVVICDLAGQRQNVYYEFGYARGVATDVLLTCPESDAGQSKLHLGHWQRIEYSDAADLKAKLVEKLKVLLPKYDLSGLS